MCAGWYLPNPMLLPDIRPGRRGVGPEQRHQLTRAALLPSRLQQQRRLLGGDVERGELTLQRCAQLTPDLVEERAATEDQADGDALARLRVWGLSVWDWTRRHAFMVDAPELAVMTATC